jgi:hypothetical protein
MSDAILRPHAPLLTENQAEGETALCDIGPDIMTFDMPSVQAEGIATLRRVSTDEQDIAMQRMFIERLLLTEGLMWDDVQHFADEGVSATKMTDLQSRPEAKKLVELCEAGAITKIFIYRVDRIFRNNKAGGAFVEWAVKHGIELVSTDLALPLSTAEGEFQFGLQVLLARRESALIAERTVGGHVSAREALKVVSHAIYGWNVCHTQDGEKTMRPNWGEQSVLQWINTNAGTISNSAMARQLNDWGVKTKLGRDWAAAGIRRAHKTPAKYQLELHRFTPPKRMSSPPFRSLSITQK